MSANSTTHDHTGRLIEQVVDHGDGTATRTRWPEGGGDPVVETIAVPVPEAEPPAPIDMSSLTRLATLDPARVEVGVGVGAELASAIGDLIKAMAALAPSNTARGPLQIVARAVEAAVEEADLPAPATAPAP